MKRKLQTRNKGHANVHVGIITTRDGYPYFHRIAASIAAVIESQASTSNVMGRASLKNEATIELVLSEK